MPLARAQKRVSFVAQRKHRQRIPRELWRDAMELLGPYIRSKKSPRFCRWTSSDLRSSWPHGNRGDLKSRNSCLRTEVRFIEIGIPSDPRGGACTIEAQSAEGRKLLIRLGAQFC